MVLPFQVAMGTGPSTPAVAPPSPALAPPSPAPVPPSHEVASPAEAPPTAAPAAIGLPAPAQLTPLVFTSSRISLDPTSAQHENRWRLERAVHVCERKLQELAHTAWSRATVSAKASLSRSLQPYQRPLATNPVKIDSWDVTMCRAVLQNLSALANKDDADAVAAIVAARNHCAHAAGGLVTTAMFEQHMTACADALTTLHGDVASLREIVSCPIDGDLAVLTCSREATKQAEREKIQGNRLFIADDVGGARDCYTRGIQVAGAVDPVVLSQLYNNRATVYLRLNEWSAAKADAKHAAELAPQWAKPHLRLAEVYKATYKPDKAVKRLEIALGYATAAKDRAMIKDVSAKMAEYRLERDQAARRESENLAYGPSHQNEGHFRAASQARLGMGASGDLMAQVDAFTALDLNGTGLEAKKHVLLGQRATSDGRLADAAREFMAAAIAGDSEGMYNYALCQLKGRGTRKNIPEAVRWLEKAASMPIDPSPAGKMTNVGIGEAMNSLANLYNGGIHFAQDKTRARELWEKSAELGVNAGLNNFGLCLMHGSHGVKKDLARAREIFRRSAETLHNEALSSLGELHASLLEFETAARWADSAAKYGFPAAASVAEEYRRSAKKYNVAAMPQGLQNALTGMHALASSQDNIPIDMTRTNKTPTLVELRAIGTPYGDRLLAAKQLAMDSVRSFDPNDPAKFMNSVVLAVAAHRIDDGELVFSPEEEYHAFMLGMLLYEMGFPVTADVALLSKPTDPSSVVALWKALQRQFPNDLDITKKAACMLTSENPTRGVQLFQRAFTLLPKPDDDSDPVTMDLLYLAGVAHFQTEDYQRSEKMLTRFLQHAPSDGHRKAAQANYILGVIAMMKGPKARNKKRNKAPNVRELAKFLQEGDRLLQLIPAFLRADAEESPHRRTLQRILNVTDSIKYPRATEPPRATPRRGGELIDGPRRHEALRCDAPSLQPKWRAEIAAMGALAANADHASAHAWTNPPARQPSNSTRGGGNYTSATIDELFSALEDRVYTGRAINCIVVSLPMFNGSSFQFVVEDSQREPARMAVYNAPPSLVAQLVPGREFQLRNPYVRLARDGSIMLRVDDPKAAIEVNAVHTICWVCSLEQGPDAKPKRCSKCSKATYCSKNCQTHDWHNDGHRVMCKVVGKMK